MNVPPGHEPEQGSSAVLMQRLRQTSPADLSTTTATAETQSAPKRSSFGAVGGLYQRLLGRVTGGRPVVKERG